MLIPCSRVQARFAEPNIRLERGAPGAMVWDEHGGTYVLRVEDLAATAGAAEEAASGIRLEISLSPREELSRSLEEFAAEQQLPLVSPSGAELEEEAVLAACHLPGPGLFIFAEAPRLRATKRGEILEIEVAGLFKSRRVPCQATDLVIHLTRPVMARLVALALSLARG